MNNLLTVIKTQIGMYAGILASAKSADYIYLNDPVAFEIMMLPAEGAIKGSIVFNARWVCYQLWTSKIEIQLAKPFFIYEVSLIDDNLIGNIYKRTISQQEKKSSLTKLH